LVASARGVAGSTARLVAASKAKADPMSPSQRKLEEAAKAVAAATAQLVEAAKIAAQIEDEEKQRKEDEEASKTQALGRKKVFDQQVEIARLEKELEKARNRVGQIRKAEYSEATSPIPQFISTKQPASKPTAKLPPPKGATTKAAKK